MKMNFDFVFVWLLCLSITIPPSEHQVYVKEWDQSDRVKYRLENIGKRFYAETTTRIEACNNMRFMYEESPHYEMGYVIGEIIERYRKMVEIATWTRQYKADTIFVTLHRVELSQKLYFEVYHLVHMMHEIERKFRNMPEFRNLTAKMNYDEMIAAEAEMASQWRWRERERRKKDKKFKKLRDIMGNRTGLQIEERKRNTVFPIDYGWEIDKEDWL